MRSTNHISDERKGWRKRFCVPRGERGVALLMAIFGLLLLTAIAAAMLFSTNTETSIAVNYRDKEAATYAAVSGLQEARDRLQPLYGDLSGFAPVNGPGPIGLPDLNNRSVLYIVNPDPSLGETAASIAPWSALDTNGNPNPYFDKELCQENYPAFVAAGVTGTVGVPCTAIPAGTCHRVGTGGPHWCHYLDNSTDPVWGLQHPLPYKWIRITLKADNSGPVWVQTPASPASGSQVCFKTGPDQQIRIPASATTECVGASTFSVSAVTLNSKGAGYSLAQPPTVSFIGGGGSGASATATLATTAGGIDLATLTNNGSGYTSPPTITITNPDGSGALFAAKIDGSPVTGVTVANNNYCYQTGTSGLAVGFNPSPPPTIGGSATTNVTMTGQACISGWTATTTCNALKDNTVTIGSVPGASGSGFSGTVNIGHNGKVASSPIQNVGSYTSVPIGPVSIDLGHNCTLNATFTGGIQISSIAVTSGGEYVTRPTATISGQPVSAPDGTTQPTLNVQWAPGAANGQLRGIQITNPGSGYANNTPGHYTLAFSGGGGSGAIGNATSTGATTYVSGLTLTNGGLGYTSTPQVVIGGPGSGATATASLGKPQQLELGAVYMLTSLARTVGGSTSMAQMEAGVMPPNRFQLGGALTLDYANPTFGTPNSDIFKIVGNDASGSGGPEPAGCDTSPGNNLPAIGVYDQNAVNTVVGGLGKPQNYIGAQSAPDVVATSAANPDPSALDQEVNQIRNQPGAQIIPGPASYNNATWGSPTNIQYIVVDGDLTLSGSPSGYGVLVVTGNLTLNGDFTWHGVVLVVGSATVNNDGGGNGQITGAMYVGGYSGNTPGTSTFNWNGGGGNGIQYDHCWADYLLNQFPPTKSAQPLQVLSTRMLEF